MGTAAKKAIIFDPYWDSLGGGERYTATVAKVLLDVGWKVDICWPKNITPEIKQRFGIDISQAHFVRDLRSNIYDLLFWLSDGSLPVSFAKKTLIHFQFPFHKVSGRSLKNLVKTRFYTFVSNSHFTKSIVDKEYRIKSHVLYPPIQVSEFVPGIKTKQILYVGRFSNLTQSKGHSILIQAFKKISQKTPDWKLILAGNTNVGTDQQLLAKLKTLARGYPIEFIIDPSFGQLQKLYATSPIFWSASGYGVDEKVQPLKVEHFGMTVVEAMAAGCVPLVANKGGHKEIITHTRDGYLWDTPDQLGEWTRELTGNSKKMQELSHSAQEKSKIFSESKFKESLLALL